MFNTNVYQNIDSSEEGNIDGDSYKNSDFSLSFRELQQLTNIHLLIHSAFFEPDTVNRYWTYRVEQNSCSLKCERSKSRD